MVRRGGAAASGAGETGEAGAHRAPECRNESVLAGVEANTLPAFTLRTAGGGE